MFEWLKEYPHVLVTGPHRAGTRICAQMIAYDTGHEYIDELDIELDSLYALSNCYAYKPRFVAQCPALCRYVHLFGSQETTAVVLMRRSLTDIAASQERIHWNNEWLELGKYGQTEGNIAEIKYRFWETEQKAQIKHAFEVDYDSLAQHPLWIPKGARGDFWPIQTAARTTMRFRAQADVFTRTEGDALIVAKIRGGSKHLNVTGQVIWSALERVPTFQDLLSALKDEFDGVDDATLEQDLRSFLDVMIKNRLVLPVSLTP